MITIGVPIRYDTLVERPIIYVFDSVRRSLQKAGARVKLILPVQDVDYRNSKWNEIPELTDEEKKLIDYELDECDGLLIPGGHKVCPYDMYILEYAIKKDIPTLGICLGMQLMSSYGNFVHFDLIESNIDHSYNDENGFSHIVSFDKNSKLYNIIGKEEIIVNSYHRRKANESTIYNIVGRSPDGVIEAIEHSNCTFNIGVQWHPEKNYDDENYKKIIDALIDAAQKKDLR